MFRTVVIFKLIHDLFDEENTTVRLSDLDFLQHEEAQKKENVIRQMEIFYLKTSQSALLLYLQVYLH